MFSAVVKSLRAKFLVSIGAAIAVVVGLSLVALLAIERNAAVERNREDRRLALEQLGNILERPLWNMEEMQINDVLAAAVRDPRFLCIMLSADRPLAVPAQHGACPSGTGSEVMRHTVVRTGAGAPVAVGHLTAHVDVAPEGAMVTRLLTWRVGLLASALLLTLLIADRIFTRIVDRPLRHVRRSLRDYRERGERHAIAWTSGDELGALIAEYNTVLALGERAEADLRMARDRAEGAYQDLAQAQNTLVQSEKMASLGRLVAGVAHEINTPLGTAVTVASALADRCRGFREALGGATLRRAALEDFVAGVGEASGLIGRSLASAHGLLQSFKQVSADQTSEVRRTFDLAAVLHEVAATLGPPLKRTRHTLSIDVPPGIRMDSYPGPLGQVVTNLVANALLHAFPPDTAGRIAITAAQDGGRVVLRVDDDGAGIPPEHIGRIFDPFFTTRLGAGGTGLGLSLVYNIVTQTLGGDIAVASRPGDGARFTIAMPATVSVAVPVAVPAAPARSPCHA